MSKTAIRVLLHDQTIGYHPILARIGGGAAEGVLLRQLLHWDGVMSNARGHEWDGWFWKVAEEIYEETGMRRSEFETARANLIKRGLIEYKARGVPNRAHYRVDLDKIEEALEHSEDFQKQYLRKAPINPNAETPAETTPEPSNLIAENEQTSLPKIDKLERAESSNQIAENRQTIHENTTRDFQKKNTIGDISPNDFADVRDEIKAVFTVPHDFDWQSVNAVCAGAPDLPLLLKVVHQLRSTQSSNLFDPPSFQRAVQFQYARKNAQRGHPNARMP